MLAEATSLEDFLSKPELVERYYSAINDLYGEKVGRSGFDAILGQLKYIRGRVPGLDDALWKPRSGPDYVRSFQIHPGLEITGLKSIEFPAQLEARLVGPLIPELAPLGDDDPAARAKQYLSEAREKILAFQQSLASVPGGKKAQGAATGAFFANLARDPKIKAATAFLIFQRLNSPSIKRTLASSEADPIFQLFEELRTDSGKQKWSDLGAGDIPPEIVRLLGDRLPSKSALMDDWGFVQETRQSRSTRWVPVGTVSNAPIEVTPMHPMHGLFKGVCLSECVGGGGNLEDLSPERWANSALKGAQVLRLTQNGRYQGWMMTVPMIGPDGMTYLALDRGSEMLRNKAWVADPGTESWTKTTLFELFVRALQAHKPELARGIVVSDSELGDAVDLRSTILGTSLYLRGAKLGPLGSFQYPEPELTKALAAVAPKGRHLPDTYGGNGIFDVVNHDTKSTTLLTETAQEWKAADFSKMPFAQKSAYLLFQLKRMKARHEVPADLVRQVLALSVSTDPDTVALAALASKQILTAAKYGAQVDDGSHQRLKDQTHELKPTLDYVNPANQTLWTLAVETGRLESDAHEYFQSAIPQWDLALKLTEAEKLAAEPAGSPKIHALKVFLADPQTAVSERALLTALKLGKEGKLPPEVTAALPNPAPTLPDLLARAVKVNAAHAFNMLVATEGPAAAHALVTSKLPARENHYFARNHPNSFYGRAEPYIYKLSALAQSTDSLVRDTALLRLLRIRSSLDTLRHMQADESSRRVLAETLAGVDAFVFLESPNDDVRRHARDVVSSLHGSKELIAYDTRKLPRESKMSGLSAKRRKHRHRTIFYYDDLIEISTLARDPDPEIRALAQLAAIEALHFAKKRQYLDEKGVEQLKIDLEDIDLDVVSFLNHESPKVRESAREVIQAMGPDFQPTCAYRFASLRAFLSDNKWAIAGGTAAVTGAGAVGYEWWNGWKDVPFPKAEGPKQKH